MPGRIVIRDKKLRIGYKDWHLKFVKRIDGKCIGECELPLKKSDIRSLGTIRILKGQDQIEKANTILHEVLHAIWYTQGIGMGAKDEERTVSAITNGLIGLMRDNPKFVKKLLEMVNEAV